MGVSVASINRWERRLSQPSALACQRIEDAERLGLDALSQSRGLKATVAEPGSSYEALVREAPPDVDFRAGAEVVRVVTEAERLSFGHLFNPTFATEISLIDPLPHQRIAVYGHMLGQPRLRFLLADDAGAGKTIMAGLYIREMLARRLVRRVLVVPPAGLLGNWKREMATLFGLPFRLITGADAKTDNPFVGTDSNLIIVSVDTLAGPRMFSRLQESSVVQYDLVIFDEAHKLSARRDPDGTFRPTDRYRLAQSLAGIRDGTPRWDLSWSPHHLLLLTATPHMGKDYPYYCLWRLLEPEILSTPDAFNAYPADARRSHFIRRTKEEMVRFDGTRIYPTRVSDTLSYDLSQGDISEQRLYDETTNYIETYYNRARILNRSAARLAMSVFQRRLASSTYALLRSFERRLQKLGELIDDIRAGKLTEEQLLILQRRLDDIPDVFDDMTGDEEATEDGREENEVIADRALGGVVALSLAELEAERERVADLLDLARRVYNAGEESKFEKLREVVRTPDHQTEKLIIFTEHRDTLNVLVRRLEGLGYAGQVASIHGGMDYREREEQVDLFRKPAADNGACLLVATDAAGEGINLQFCWRMVNYDIPWNPARLEQRMGRIHRYKQSHDPVIIINLVAGKTREGRVLRILLEKLERIRKELQSDKVFDVVGRLFQGVSIKEYMAQALTEEGAEEVARKIEGTLTKEQVVAQQEWERRIYGEGGDVKARLSDEKVRAERDEMTRLLPGYVRRFIENAAPLLDIAIDGDLETGFALKPLKPLALEPLWPALESYPAARRVRLMVRRPPVETEGVFVHPGEPIFERLRVLVAGRLGRQAYRGAAFIDPQATRSYLFHLAEVAVVRKPDPTIPALVEQETLETRLVGLRQWEDGDIEPCAIEHLLLLRGIDGVPVAAMRASVTAKEACARAVGFLEASTAAGLAESHRTTFVQSLDERLAFVAKGYDFQDAELAARRSALTDRARAGDSKVAADLIRVKDRQRELASRREQALATLRREPDLIVAGSVRVIANALVLPSADPEDKRSFDAQVEAIAMQVAIEYERAARANVRDVSTPPLARAAGLHDHPGFDLHSKRAEGDERAIEVKGRAGVEAVELTENEWAKACNLRDRYWLYVVFDCGSPSPRLARVRDPFGKLVARCKGGVIIRDREVLEAAEP